MPHIPAAVCVPCRRAYVPLSNGHVYEARTINREPTLDGRPYYKISGDILECPSCGHQILAQFGRAIEPHNPYYAPTVVEETFRV